MRERGYTQGTHFLTGCFYTPIPSGSDGDESSCNAGDPGSISRSWWSPGEGNGNLLQYFCLGNPMDRGAWRAIVHRVTKSRTWLKRRTHTQNALRYLISMKNNQWTKRLYVFKSFVFFFNYNNISKGITHTLLLTESLSDHVALARYTPCSGNLRDSPWSPGWSWDFSACSSVLTLISSQLFHSFCPWNLCLSQANLLFQTCPAISSCHVVAGDVDSS